MERHGCGHRTTLSFDGIPLHYTVAGTAPPVVLLIHGWSCRQDFWRAQTAAFGRAYRVVTLDLAGHGCSRATVDRRGWSIEAFARDVEAVADAVDARSLVLVGHSMGGAVAVEATLRLGTRCRLLLGVDTFTDAAFYARRPAAEIAQRCAPFAAGFAATMTTMVDDLCDPAVAPDLREWIAASMSATDPAVALRALEALLSWDIERAWPRLRCPAYAINSERLCRRYRPLPLARLVEHRLPGAGHFVMLESVAPFNVLAASIIGQCVDGTHEHHAGAWSP